MTLILFFAVSLLHSECIKNLGDRIIDGVQFPKHLEKAKGFFWNAGKTNIISNRYEYIYGKLCPRKPIIKFMIIFLSLCITFG